MKLLNLANALFEGIVGLILLFTPTILLLNPDPLAISLARTFAIAALSVALLSALMLRSKSHGEVQIGLMVLLAFHIGQTVIQLLGYLDGFTPLPIVFIHVLFALSYGYVYRSHRLPKSSV